ncbi:FAD/NAD(P)-binding protein [Kitasatospora sp. MAP5-34]|uniref:FAD/NAD(P)-binding protein n=1 Tax=Kitasatospora sp. MAP5-34 TaxID=3035102 RepID=UPI002473D7B1|nr:FAD/NAD(P)-binding protein [Kitasatospora sp. MAP5-34]MDH6579067.1 putative NAD(P)/FAD-binding protein YdhS [Kitasatospora sp. MAP5-34]
MSSEIGEQSVNTNHVNSHLNSSSRVEIGIVGAGPRGLSVLERLCANERKSPSAERLTVHVVDPSPAGAGRVWRTVQPRHLLMNTVASQVTIFTDDSVNIDGPLEEGPALYTWAKLLAHGALDDLPGPVSDETLAEARDLGPDSYPTRALYGTYLSWVFSRVVAGAPAHVEICLHRSRAVALDDEETGPGGTQELLLEDGTRLTGLAAVVLALGHVPLLASESEIGFAAFAGANGLNYVSPANPADVDLSVIAPGETVALRGLGLNFFDHMALLTVGRGGSFDRDDQGKLVYRPSGTEPHLVAGSRRGIPYHARGDNEKGAHGRYLPRLLTPEWIGGLKDRAAEGGWVNFGTDLWPLISKEVRSVYYSTLLTARADGTDVSRFLERYLGVADGPDEDRLLDEARVTQADRWDWERIGNPYGDREFADSAEFKAWLLEHLAADVRAARLGNVSGPLKAALDVLRDLRNEIRMVVDHGGLEGNSHRDELESWYTPLNAFLSIGPPASRIEELVALMEAGVVEIAGPGMRVRAEDEESAFVVTAGRIPGLRVLATTLIEARLPEPDLRRTADPLLRHLLASGQCRPYRIHGAAGTEYETGGLAVTGRPYRVVDAQGQAHPRRFAYGVPTESVHWVTAAGIRPGVGSVTLEDSDAIVQAVRSLPPVPARQACAGAAVGRPSS